MLSSIKFLFVLLTPWHFTSIETEMLKDMTTLDLGAFKYYVSRVGGGGLSQNTDIMTLWIEGVGELKNGVSFLVKYV